MKVLLAALLSLPLLVDLPVIQAQAAGLPSYREQALQAAYQAGVAFQPQAWPETAHSFPEVVQAILIAESRSCRRIHNPKGPNAIGCMQLYNGAVKQVVGFLINRRALEQNWVLNIRIGSKYLAYCFSITHQPYLSISCYHAGPFAYHYHDPYVANIVNIMDSLPVDTQ